jgi:hypothetical protein
MLHTGAHSVHILIEARLRGGKGQRSEATTECDGLVVGDDVGDGGVGKITIAVFVGMNCRSARK